MILCHNIQVRSVTHKGKPFKSTYINGNHEEILERSYLRPKFNVDDSKNLFSLQNLWLKGDYIEDQNQGWTGP